MNKKTIITALLFFCACHNIDKKVGQLCDYSRKFCIFAAELRFKHQGLWK